MRKLELSISPGSTPQPLPIASSRGAVIACVVAKEKWNAKDFSRADELLMMGAVENNAGHCHLAMLATSIPPYPTSMLHADMVIGRFHGLVDALLAQNELALRGGTDDSLTFCLNTAFYHSFYYRAEWKETMSKYYRLILKAFPEHAYTAPFLLPSPPECKPRVRLGIASAFFEEGSSVHFDFHGVLDHLSRDKFEIFLIAFTAEKMPFQTFNLYRGQPGDQKLEIKRSVRWAAVHLSP